MISLLQLRRLENKFVFSVFLLSSHCLLPLSAACLDVCGKSTAKVLFASFIQVFFGYGSDNLPCILIIIIVFYDLRLIHQPLDYLVAFYLELLPAIHFIAF